MEGKASDGRDGMEFLLAHGMRWMTRILSNFQPLYSYWLRCLVQPNRAFQIPFITNPGISNLGGCRKFVKGGIQVSSGFCFDFTFSL